MGTAAGRFMTTRCLQDPRLFSGRVTVLMHKKMLTLSSLRLMKRIPSTAQTLSGGEGRYFPLFALLSSSLLTWSKLTRLMRQLRRFSGSPGCECCRLTLLSKEKVPTKEFTERSVFLYEQDEGRWFYAGGDKDFEPTNVRVSSPKPRPKRSDGGGPSKLRAPVRKQALARAKAG